MANNNKNPGGRPPKYTDVQLLQKKIDNYFKKENHPTLSGLAIELGMDRDTLRMYGKKEGFSGTIKKARDRIEKIYEEKLIYTPQATGMIFALKNFGWKDKQKVKHIPDGKSIEVISLKYYKGS